MKTFKKAVVLRNVFESQLMEQILKAEEIPHVIRSHEDTAYGQVFTPGLGWGRIEAPQEQHERIRSFLEEIRNGEVEMDQKDAGYHPNG